MNCRQQCGYCQCEQDIFSKDAQGIMKIFLDFWFLLSFLQLKAQNESRNITYYGLYYTVLKKLIEVEKKVTSTEAISGFLFLKIGDSI